MTQTIDLLHRAVDANPHEDVPLLMLADAYREEGCEAAGAFAELWATWRKAPDEVLPGYGPSDLRENPFRRLIADLIQEHIVGPLVEANFPGMQPPVLTLGN